MVIITLPPKAISALQPNIISNAATAAKAAAGTAPTATIQKQTNRRKSKI